MIDIIAWEVADATTEAGRSWARGNRLVKTIELFLFNLLFGYPTANFGQITWGQPHSTNVT